MSAPTKALEQEIKDADVPDPLEAQAHAKDDQIVQEFLAALDDVIMPGTSSEHLDAFSRFFSRLPSIQSHHLARAIASGTRTRGLPQAVNRKEYLDQFPTVVRTALTQRYRVK